MKKVCYTIIMLAVLLAGGQAYAQEERGVLIAQGQYFDLYADANVDAYALLSKFDFNYLVYSSGFAQQDKNDLKSILAQTLDGLYQEVSDILDIHIYSFKGRLQVVADQAALAAFLKQQFNLDFEERSIYYHEKKIIYISAADLTVGMLGHEMAHAIISQYFVVPPPPKIQEVLCGYVEYTLRKTHDQKN